MSLGHFRYYLNRLFDEDESEQWRCTGGSDDEWEEGVGERVDFIARLPVELAELILSHLSARDICACAKVSVAWHEAANSSLLWRTICAHSLSPSPHLKLDKQHYECAKSNFKNWMRRFRVSVGGLSQSQSRLSPMNAWKVVYCQRNFVAYNWARGVFASHQLTNEEAFEERPLACLRLHFPSALPLDRRLLPCQTTALPLHSLALSLHSLQLVRLDGEPRVSACRLPLLSTAATFASIDRHSLVFVQDGKVKSVELGAWVEAVEEEAEAEAEEAAEEVALNVRVLGSLFAYSDPGLAVDADNYFIDMDDQHIVAAFKYACIKVWCRASFQLLHTFCAKTSDTCFPCCHLYDNCLHYSSWCPRLQQGEVFVHRLSAAPAPAPKHTFPCSHEVKRMLCNELYFVLMMKENVNRNVIEVRERETNLVRAQIDQNTSENWGLPVPVALLLDEQLFYLEGSTIKVMHLRKAVVTQVLSVQSVIAIESIVDSLLMVRLRDRIEIWDWKENVKLHSPVLDCFARSAVYCDETRLVVVDPRKGISVHGFW